MLLKYRITATLMLVLVAIVCVSCGSKEPPAVPKVMRQAPLPSEELGVKSPFVIEFNQPMDAKSLQDQVRIEPEVAGEWSVTEHRLVFHPMAALDQATTYRVVVGTGVKSSAGLPLADEVVLRFQTVGYLRVSQAQPAEGAQEVERNTAVMVIFNRPVVPLTDLKTASGLPQPLRLEPSVEGAGEWLNTSIYVFRPRDGLAGSTTYRATVAAGLQDSTGSALAEDYTWTFTTESPKVIAFQPQGMKAAPTAQVMITFNQPMDEASVQAGFSMRNSETNELVAGMFTWEKETVIFKPNVPLDMGLGYIVDIPAGVRSASGGSLVAALQWQFGVVPRPQVIGTTPGKDLTSVSPYEWVQFRFAGPMRLDTITPTLRVEPQGTEWQAYWSEYDDALQLSIRLQPATAYRIAIPGTAADPYGNTLGQDYVLSFRTRDLDPSVYFADRWGDATVFSAYSDVKIPIGYRNIRRVSLNLYSLSEDEFLRLNGDDWQYRNEFGPRPASLLRAWNLNVNPPRNTPQVQDVALMTVAGRVLPPGFYYMTMSSPDIVDKAYSTQKMTLVVTRANLVLKHGPRDVLVWATDLVSGRPIPALPLTVYDRDGKVLLSGTTDAEGVWRATFAESRDVWETLMAVAGSGDWLSAASSQWSDGLDPWEFSLSSESWVNPYVGHFYTDRPIYRPGQTVHFKGIIRADDDARYALPGFQTLRVTVSDPQGQQFYSQTLTVSNFGSVYGDIVLAEGAPTGTYWLYADPVDTAPSNGYKSYATAFSTSFQLAEYRKPEYQISVATDRAEYTQGDSIQVAVQAQYYFGGPVANARVRWNVVTQPYYFRWQGQGWYNFSDWDYWYSMESGPQVVATGETTTDAEGRVAFTLPADIAKYTASQTFSIEAVVTDVNGQEVSGRTAVSVHKGEFYIGLAPKAYIGTAGKPQEVMAITVDSKSNPVGNVPLTVVFSLRKWYSVQEQVAGGGFYWTTRFDDTPVFTQTITTNARGEALASFVSEKGGSYRVLATGRDARGNEVRSAAYLWVSDAGEYVFWRMDNNSRIELIADKKLYAPGETARVLIPSPFQGEVTALLTVERAGVLSHQVLTLQSNSEQVEIPITNDLIPNAFVSVVLVKGRSADDPFASFRVGYVKLEVSSAEKQLTVRVTPDRTGNYGPRDTARFTVETLDASGRGVPAEVSLALVDASVLALADRPGPEIEDFFYRQRGLGIRTAVNISMAPREREAESPSDNKGGGGAEPGADTRTFFPDTAYWEPALRTDSQGRAEVSITLPDSLTTWRMLSEGATVATQVGSSQTDIIATKDLLVRPVLPRFLVIGDRPELAAVVHNNTDRAIQVLVEMEATAGQGGSGGGRNVEVPARGLQKVVWTDFTARAGDEVTITFRASGGGLEDAVSVALPVHHYTTPEVTDTAGDVLAGEQRVEIVQLPDVYEPTQGDLTVRVDPSLVAGMEEGFTYLEHFPYECAEQTVSRFLPNVVTWRAYQQLSVRDEELEAKLPGLVSVGLQKLFASQNPDGGWGWWSVEESHPFITAYVLLGMNEARNAGFGVDESVMERGVRYLARNLDVAGVNSSSQADRHAFMLYVLSEAGAGDTGRAVALYDKRHLLGQYGKALLAMALQSAGDAHAGQVSTLTSELTGQAILSATGAHWEEAETDRYMMVSDVRSTAIVLKALTRLTPDSALLPNAARWLMAAREQGRWGTTQENAWAIMALTDFAIKTGELQGEYRFQVGLNGKRVLSGEVLPSNVGDGIQVSVPLADLLKNVGNRIILERSPLGRDQAERGSLYYSAYLKYYLPVPLVQPLNRGIIVMRQYALDGKPDQEIHEARVSDIIRVKLTVIAPSALHYLVVEDPIPAGAEAVDTSLKTTSQLLDSPVFQKSGVDDVWGWWIFSHTEIRDEKVALFASHVPAGTYEYTYLLRASVPGQFLVMPTTAYEMYFPETFGRSAGDSFVINAE